MDIKKLLQARKDKKSKKPTFSRRGLYRAKISKKWRHSKGIHNKVGVEGSKPKEPRPGYGSPTAVKGFHHSGKQVQLVNNVKELQGVNKETHAIMISSTVGNRKRILMLTKAKELGLMIINFKDPDAFVQKVNSKKAEMKKEKEEKQKKKSEKAKKEDKKKEEKSIEKKIESEEEKKEAEKKEFDTLLTKSK